MPLSEPVTTLTDYALALASLGFAIALRRRIGPRNRVSGWCWFAAFLASAIAAAAGGTFHGFATELGAGTLRRLWNLTMMAIGACGAFITVAVYSASIGRDGGAKIWLVRGIIVTVVGLAVLQSGFPRAVHFNYNDAYHLIQLVGLYCFFRCAQAASDGPVVPRDRTGA
jgi:hypothetical protein